MGEKYPNEGDFLAHTLTHTNTTVKNRLGDRAALDHGPPYSSFSTSARKTDEKKKWKNKGGDPLGGDSRF